MLTQDNLLILAFEQDFREQFPQLDEQFQGLDALGGRNCKNCSKNRQKLLINQIYNSIIKAGLSEKYQKYYEAKVAAGGIYAEKAPETVSGHNVNYAKMPLSLDQFITCLLFIEVREVLYRHLNKKVENLIGFINSHGAYSPEVRSRAKVIYNHIFLDPLFTEFSALIKKLDIMDRVKSNPNPLKVKILDSSENLEEEVNRFILDKNVISIQKDGRSVLVTYR